MTTYIYAALGALIVTLGVLLWLSHLEVGHFQAQSIERLALIDQAGKDNKAQAGAIDELRAANGKWARDAKVQHEAYAGALADLARSNVARRAANESLRAREGAERAQPACGALLAIDLAAACPIVAQGLRERAK